MIDEIYVEQVEVTEIGDQVCFTVMDEDGEITDLFMSEEALIQALSEAEYIFDTKIKFRA